MSADSTTQTLVGLVAETLQKVADFSASSQTSDFAGLSAKLDTVIAALGPLKDKLDAVAGSEVSTETITALGDKIDSLLGSGVSKADLNALGDKLDSILKQVTPSTPVNPEPPAPPVNPEPAPPVTPEPPAPPVIPEPPIVPNPDPAPPVNPEPPPVPPPAADVPNFGPSII